MNIVAYSIFQFIKNTDGEKVQYDTVYETVKHHVVPVLPDRKLMGNTKGVKE